MSTVAVEQTAAPRLEPVDAAGASAAPSSPPVGSPPPADAFDPFGATLPGAGAAPVRQPWTPEEAASMVTGGHNLAGAILYGTKPELFEAFHADPKELDPQAAALARILDRTPLQPGGEGPLGIVGDLLISLNAVVGMEMRHVDAVRKARARVERRVVEQMAQEQPGAPAPVPPAATPGAPAAANGGGNGAYHFGGKDLEFLTGVTAQLPTDSIKEAN